MEIHDRCCQGLSASASSQRRTVDGETRTLQRVASWRVSSGLLHRDNGTPVAAGSSHANAITSARTASGSRRGRPGRAASRSPLNRSTTNRLRHLRAVSTPTPTVRAIAAFAWPSAAASTIRARIRSRWEVRVERARRDSSRRSDSIRTTMNGLDTGM
jgi:hypothetical protein